MWEEQLPLLWCLRLQLGLSLVACLVRLRLEELALCQCCPLVQGSK